MPAVTISRTIRHEVDGHKVIIAIQVDSPTMSVTDYARPSAYNPAKEAAGKIADRVQETIQSVVDGIR